MDWNRVLTGDCIEHLTQLPAESVDLAFADPPFNIGYDYDVYDDKQDREAYLDWSGRWMASVTRTLKPNGTFWLAIGDEYAAELKILAQDKLGLTCRSWVVWYYTFGVNCKRKFSRSHAHLFHFVKNPREFTFNADEIRVPSARMTTYADARANPKGRIPDDTWVLRPQDLTDGWDAEDDTWYFPRVAGTFKERQGFHGCQMPERLLERIIKTSSNEGEVVLDPFAGSGTTLAVAKKLYREFLGIELSPDYVQAIEARLDAIIEGDPPAGPADPKSSAPTTPTAPKRRRPRTPRLFS
jgi:site-specific DNA-methyltransferase (adenine-specific)